MSNALYILLSMRPAQWVKNALIFAPLLFAQRALETESFLKVSLAFLLFCLLSGGTYLVNDVRDRHLDAKHPAKKRRPVASEKLAPATAAAIGILFCLVAVTTSILINPLLFLVFAAYLVVSFTYSLLFKNIVILDVMCLSSGFLLRVIAGAFAIPVPPSFWLMICTTLLALFLALGKRRHEIVLLEGDAPAHRPVLREYSPYLLDQMISLVSTSTVLSYALYSISPDVSAKLGTSWMGLTTPFVLYGVLRYLYLIHRREKGGDPTQVILRDVPLVVDLTLWSLTSAAILYLQ